MSSDSSGEISTIDQVIHRLGEIIDWAKLNNSRVGYFAALYLRVTNTIKSKIGTGYFDDDARMERLDVNFAHRYFLAFDQWCAKDPNINAAWDLAFKAVENEDLIVVQHLLLAMNPHINIDLGSAAAAIAPGSAINDLKDDFMKINDVLGSIVPTVIDEIGDISPLIHLVNDLAEDEEEIIINFSMKVAREFAWTLAKLLARGSEEEQKIILAENSRIVTALSEKVIEPGQVIESVLETIRAVESKSVLANIDVLNTGNPMPNLQDLLEKLAAWSGEGTPPNKVYYFDVAQGTWTGTFNFKVTSWSNLWKSGIGLKNIFLVTSMAVVQKIFGDGTISSVIQVFPKKGKAGVAHNTFHIKKAGITLFRSDEDYILSPNGTGVTVDAHVRFGPIPFLFKEHDVYPATIYDGGMRAVYFIKLLATQFLGNYTVAQDRKQVHSVLTSSFAVADETLNKEPT